MADARLMPPEFDMSRYADVAGALEFGSICPISGLEHDAGDDLIGL